jgi:hypothetical protein
MLMKCFMKSVVIITGLAAIAVAAEILTDAVSANCHRIGSSARHIRFRGCRP